MNEAQVNVGDGLCQVQDCDERSSGEMIWQFLSPHNPTNGRAFVCKNHAEAIQESALHSFWREFAKEA